MDKKIDTSPTPPTMEWDMRDEKEPKENVDTTFTERSSDDNQTVCERSVNDEGTMLKRSMNGIRNFFFRVNQTKNATQMRVNSLKKKSEIPKAKVYANIAEWLNDCENIQDATNFNYPDVDHLTDNPPQSICDKLNEIMPPEDKSKWTPQNLMPVVFSVKLERVKKRYFSPTQYFLTVAVAMVLLMFSWGWIGPNEDEAKPINVEEYLKKWEERHNFQFFGYRRKDVILKEPGLNSSNIEEYLERQRFLQDSLNNVARKKNENNR